MLLLYIEEEEGVAIIEREQGRGTGTGMGRDGGQNCSGVCYERDTAVYRGRRS